MPKDCFTRRILPFFLFSVVNYSQLCSFRPMHTQFRSILHDLESFDQAKKHFYCFHQIAPGLQFQPLTRQNKGKKICCLFQTLTGKSFKIVCRNIVTLSFQKCTELFFYTKLSHLLFYTDAFGLTPSTFSSKDVLQKEFCHFFLFSEWNIPNFVHWSQAHSIFVTFSWLEIIRLRQKTY